jgi:hypothetical protein
MRGAIYLLPQYAFIAWCAVKKEHRDSFSFSFTPLPRLFRSEFYTNFYRNGNFIWYYVDITDVRSV